MGTDLTRDWSTPPLIVSESSSMPTGRSLEGRTENIRLQLWFVKELGNSRHVYDSSARRMKSKQRGSGPGSTR